MTSRLVHRQFWLLDDCIGTMIITDHRLEIDKTTP
jgi:hypothetical protein